MTENDPSIFRENMGSALFKADQEKSKTHMLLNRDEVSRIKKLLSQPLLTLDEVSEVQAIFTANQSKLGKYNPLERYVHHKVFIQLQKVATRYSKAIMADMSYEQELKRDSTFFDAETIKVRQDIQKDYALCYKNLVNGILFGINSSLSDEGYLIEELNKEKKDYTYSGNLSPVPQPNQQKVI
jgi:hypothetical protein